jgi:hypothetical protein
MATSENAPNWAKDFLQELLSGAINSTTKAKDQATILWREKSWIISDVILIVVLCICK